MAVPAPAVDEPPISHVEAKERYATARRYLKRAAHELHKLPSAPPGHSTVSAFETSKANFNSTVVDVALTALDDYLASAKWATRWTMALTGAMVLLTLVIAAATAWSALHPQPPAVQTVTTFQLSPMTLVPPPFIQAAPPLLSAPTRDR